MGYREHHVAVKLLLAVFAFAIYSMWVMSLQNGYLDSLLQLVARGPFVLPGSTTPLLQSYTGISPLDRWLTFLQCVFANLTDGSAPHLLLLAIYSISQWNAVITSMVVESQRSFNRGKVVSWYVDVFGSLDLQSPSKSVMYLSSLSFLKDRNCL